MGYLMGSVTLKKEMKISNQVSRHGFFIAQKLFASRIVVIFHRL